MTASGAKVGDAVTGGWGGKPCGSAQMSCPAAAAKIVMPQVSQAKGRVKLAVVGDNPMYGELKSNTPMAGSPADLMARGARHVLGLPRDQIHWTNAVLCECHKDDLAKAAKACGPRLRQELAAIAPEAVLPVGAMALKSTLALKKKPQILQWRGSVTQHAWGESATTSTSLILPMLPPWLAGRSPSLKPIFELDFERVGRVLESYRPPEESPKRKLVIAQTRETLTRTLKLMGPVVSADVETVGLGPTHTRLVCFGLSDGTITLVIPWARASNGLEPWWGFDGTGVATEILEFFESRASVVTHNGPGFDHIVLKRYGMWSSNIQWDDTLLAQHATNGHLKKNLAFVVTTAGGVGLDVPPWKQLEDRGVALDRLWVYNGRDCLYTVLAWMMMKDEVR